MIVKESGDYGISANAGDEEGDTAEGIEATKEKVIDIVDAHRLVACPFDKKSYMGYIKTYMVCYCLSCVVKKSQAKIREHIKKTNPAREQAFVQEATEFVKKIIGHFDDYS